MSDDDQPNTKHKLQIVGRTGVQEAYLDISREEACRRYQNEMNTAQVLPIDAVDTVHFNEQFQVVDVWKSDRDPDYDEDDLNDDS